MAIPCDNFRWRKYKLKKLRGKESRMENIFTVYRITNTITQQTYIGQTMRPTKRFAEHLSKARNDKNQSPLYNDIRLYGEECFEYCIIETELNKNEAQCREQYFIDYYRKKHLVYNRISAGSIKNNRKVTDLSKESMSDAKATLSYEVVCAIRLAYQEKQSPKKIYNLYCKDVMTFDSFMNVWTGKRYKHIMPEVFQPNVNRCIKYTAEDIIAIREYKINNPSESYNAIARRFNMPTSTVTDIIKRRTWKHI